LHYVLDRPHLNDGARVVRVKPRYNPDVNQWWLCDEGRYGLGWIDRQRLSEVRGPAGAAATWDEALAAIAAAMAAPARIGVIASGQLTNEELFLIRELFQGMEGGAALSASVPSKPGSHDQFLVKADKQPNTLGASLLGLIEPTHVSRAPDAEAIVDLAAAGHLDCLWVFGHDLVELFGEERVREAVGRVKLLVFSGTNGNATVPFAHWVLPSAAYVEKDGTFVNCHGRIQRIGRAFPPLPGTREDWRVLLELAALCGRPFAWREPRTIFLGLAQAVAAFAGASYETIGTGGVDVARTAPVAPEAAAP
jgi:NADH-quinone oxidoreductase subunit G